MIVSKNDTFSESWRVTENFLGIKEDTTTFQSEESNADSRNP